jgi:hypothetical protein
MLDINIETSDKLKFKTLEEFIIQENYSINNFIGDIAILFYKLNFKYKQHTRKILFNYFYVIQSQYDYINEYNKDELIYYCYKYISYKINMTKYIS